MKEVPALGYAQYYIKVKDAPRPEIQGTTELKETHVENPWYAIDFNTRKGTIRKLYDKDLNKQLVTPDAEWEMGEFIYEIIDSRHPMEQYRAPNSSAVAQRRCVSRNMRKAMSGIHIVSGERQ